MTESSRKFTDIFEAITFCKVISGIRTSILFVCGKNKRNDEDLIRVATKIIPLKCDNF